MTPARRRAARWVEGAAASAIVGLAGASVVAGDATTAEAARTFWLATTVTGGAVAPRGAGGLRAASLACVPLVAGIWAGSAQDGRAGLALFVVRALLRGTAVPLAGWTERDMAFRYGLLSLFIFVASPPACLAATLAWGWLGRAVASLATWTPVGPPMLGVALSAWRWSVALGAAAVAGWT